MATLGSAGSTYLAVLLGNMGLQLSTDNKLNGEDLIEKTGNSTTFYNDLQESMQKFEEVYLVLPDADEHVQSILRTHKNFTQTVIDCFVKAKIDGGINMSQDVVDVFTAWVKAVLQGLVDFNSEITGKDSEIKTMKELCELYGYDYNYLITNKTYPWFYLSIILKMLNEGVPVIGLLKQPNNRTTGNFSSDYISTVNKTLSFFYPIDDITDTVTYNVADFPFPDGSVLRPSHTTGESLTIPRARSVGSLAFFESSINFNINSNKLQVRLAKSNTYPKCAFTASLDVVYGPIANNNTDFTDSFYRNIPDCLRYNEDLTQTPTYIIYQNTEIVRPSGGYYPNSWWISTMGDNSFAITLPKPLMAKKLNGQNNATISLNDHDETSDWWVDSIPCILQGAKFQLTLNIVNQKLVDLLLNGKMVLITKGDGINFDIDDETKIGDIIDNINAGNDNWNNATAGVISVGDKESGVVVDGNGDPTNTTINDKKDELNKDNPATPNDPNPDGIASSDFITMYVVGNVTLRQLASKLWSKDFIDSIYKMYADPVSAIVSLHAVPAFLAYGSGWNGIKDIKIGNYATGIPANVVTAQYSSTYFYMNETPVENLKPYWLNYEPYSTYQIYLPFIGFQNIPSEVAFNVKKIKYTMDYLTGDLTATLLTQKDTTLAVFDGNCAIYTPVTGDNFGRFYSQAISTASNLIANPSGAGLLQATGSVLSSLDAAGAIKMSGSVSGNKGFLSPGNIFIVKHYSDVYGDLHSVTNISKIGGVQYGLVEKVGHGSDGWLVKASSVYTDGIGGTDSERKEMEQLLMEGVYY